jgi:hypothetical protein
MPVHRLVKMGARFSTNALAAGSKRYGSKAAVLTCRWRGRSTSKSGPRAKLLCEVGAGTGSIVSFGRSLAVSGRTEHAKEHYAGRNFACWATPPKGLGGYARAGSTEITDSAVTAARVTPAIAETVKRQVETAIDYVTGSSERPAASRITPRISLTPREVRRSARGTVYVGSLPLIDA